MHWCSRALQGLCEISFPVTARLYWHVVGNNKRGVEHMRNTQGAGFVRREGGAKGVLMLRLEFALKWQLTRL